MDQDEQEAEEYDKGYIEGRRSMADEVHREVDNMSTRGPRRVEEQQRRNARFDDPDNYPYPLNQGRTHWDGCWRVPRHHNCAVAKVMQLQNQAEDRERLL